MNNINRYSPKETLGLLIIANENVNFKKIDNLILSLEKTLQQKKCKNEILENIDIKFISQIENYWELKLSQVIAYGYIIFNHFCISDEELTPENITKNFIYQMRLYSPDNAVEFIERKFNIRLEVKDHE